MITLNFNVCKSLLIRFDIQFLQLCDQIEIQLLQLCTQIDIQLLLQFSNLSNQTAINSCLTLIRLKWEPHQFPHQLCLCLLASSHASRDQPSLLLHFPCCNDPLPLILFFEQQFTLQISSMHLRPLFIYLLITSILSGSPPPLSSYSYKWWKSRNKDVWQAIFLFPIHSFFLFCRLEMGIKQTLHQGMVFSNARSVDCIQSQLCPFNRVMMPKKVHNAIHLTYMPTIKIDLAKRNRIILPSYQSHYFMIHWSIKPFSESTSYYPIFPTME